MLHIAFRALPTAPPVSPPLAGTQPGCPASPFPPTAPTAETAGTRPTWTLPRAPSTAITAAGCVRTIRNHRFAEIAAVGVVSGVRDGLDASSLSEDGGDCSWQRVECGNGVGFDHCGGWTTRYCHIRRNSVTANRGAWVAAGDLLGLFGAPVISDAPQLHLRVERARTPVGIAAGSPWRAPVRQASAACEPVVTYPAVPAVGRPASARIRCERFPAEAARRQCLDGLPSAARRSEPPPSRRSSPERTAAWSSRRGRRFARSASNATSPFPVCPGQDRGPQQVPARRAYGWRSRGPRVTGRLRPGRQLRHGGHGKAPCSDGLVRQ